MFNECCTNRKELRLTFLLNAEDLHATCQHEAVWKQGGQRGYVGKATHRSCHTLMALVIVVYMWSARINASWRTGVTNSLATPEPHTTHERIQICVTIDHELIRDL